jgi:alpha-beta hydrolase superfamily lysophospholipase
MVEEAIVHTVEYWNNALRRNLGGLHRRRRRRSIKWPSGIVAISVLAIAPATAAYADAPPTLTCSAHTLAVRIADPGPADQTLWGELCYLGAQEPSAVQVLVHGATYDHRYWDFPYGGSYYSYVAAATTAGYATFDVDRIGDGNSSHPGSSALDLNAGAVALHDAITALRTGAADGHAFLHVIMVGHSIGSIEAWIEAARYHDVDALIATGVLHEYSPNIGALQTTLYPAVDDPKFAGSGLDTGYLTTQPGTRGSSFYYPATADPNVVAIDEMNKETVTVPELVGANSIIGIPPGLPPGQQPSSQITVPVLAVVGEKDALFCTAVTVYDCSKRTTVLKFESQFYSPAAHLQLAVIPNTGHDLALSTTAPITDAVMIGWSLSTVAP